MYGIVRNVLSFYNLFWIRERKLEALFREIEYTECCEFLEDLGSLDAPVAR